MLVRHVMNRSVVTAKLNTTLKEAAAVMSKLNIGSLIILGNEGEISGIITSTDILKAIASGKDVETTLVEEVMSKPVITIEPDKSVEDAVNIMLEHKIKKLPVVEEGKLVGIITASDIITIEPKLIENIATLISLKLPGYKGG
jgi:CBS domain-containing protein